MEFLNQCELLKIEDILPFFQDFVTIDHFKVRILTTHMYCLGGLSPQKGARTESAKGSLHYRGSVLWNKIPSEIRKLPSLNVFKTSFRGKDFSNTP